MSTGTALAVGALLLVLNAFFVAAEFALVASRVHRLEQRAAGGSRAARAALTGARELSLMLAGAQLGITLCTLGLGALAEPALEHLLHPVFTALGVPDQIAYLLALLVGVAIVVLLHMVIGEMAPKSWAISHPETSATWLALPFRAFTRLTRPALTVLNGAANALVRLLGVTPVGDNSTQLSPADLLVLLAQSREHQVLPLDEHHRLTGALRLEHTRLGDRTRPMAQAVTIDAHATSAQVEQVSRARGKSRLVVLWNGTPAGIVHVRDALLETTGHPESLTQVRHLMRLVPVISAALPLIDALAHMRAERAQLAFVHDTAGQIIGLTAMEDLIEEVLGHFEDETDPTPGRHT